MTDGRGDAPAWLVGVLRLLGRSPIQAEWQARKLAARFKGAPRRGARAPGEARSGPSEDEGASPPRSGERRHRATPCPSCGGLVDVREPRCPKCGEAMPSAAARAIGAIGLRVPEFVSASSLLGVAILVVYLRMMLALPKSGYLSWEVHDLIAFGANFGPAVLREQQVHRLLTSIFLHIGLLHLGFNLVALSQIGPRVEEVFGRGRTVFLFVLTGMLGSLTSAYLGVHVSAGASGAISGLIGVAAGWGHRSGTLAGRELRNRMLLWMGYTTVYGFVVGADHAAHGGGFVSGALIGTAWKPLGARAGRQSAGAIALGVVGTVAALVGFLLAVRPPASSYAYAERFKPMTENFARPYGDHHDQLDELDQLHEVDELDAGERAPGARVPDGGP